jgi:hypothetical protein
MTSKRTYPQLVQNGIEMMNPTKQRANATNIRGIFFPAGVSQITVDVASTIENAESMPSMNNTNPRSTVQTFDPGISSIAAGYAIKARPAELVLVLAMLLVA